MNFNNSETNFGNDSFLDRLFLLGTYSDLVDQITRKEQGFGRYIHATRRNIGLSRSEVSHETGIPFDTLFEMEMGVYQIEYIEDFWVSSLADVLGEKEENLFFVLGREIIETGTGTQLRLGCSSPDCCLLENSSMIGESKAKKCKRDTMQPAL